MLSNIAKLVTLAGTAVGVADQGKKIGANRSVRKNLADLFRENFLTADGSIRPGVVEVECAGLRFVRERNLVKDWSGGEYLLVRIINDAKLGDDPERVRRMGYFPKSKKIGFPPAWLETY